MFFGKVNINLRYSFYKSWWCGLRDVCGECQIAVRQTRKCLTEICQTWPLGLESRLTQLIAAFPLGVRTICGFVA